MGLVLPQQSGFPATILPQMGKRGVVQTPDNRVPTLLAVPQGQAGTFPEAGADLKGWWLLEEGNGFVSLLILALVSFPLGSQEKGERPLVLTPPFPGLERSVLLAARRWRMPKSPVSAVYGASAERRSGGNMRII